MSIGMYVFKVNEQSHSRHNNQYRTRSLDVCLGYYSKTNETGTGFFKIGLQAPIVWTMIHLRLLRGAVHCWPQGLTARLWVEHRLPVCALILMGVHWESAISSQEDRNGSKQDMLPPTPPPDPPDPPDPRQCTLGWRVGATLREVWRERKGGLGFGGGETAETMMLSSGGRKCWWARLRGRDLKSTKNTNRPGTLEYDCISRTAEAATVPTRGSDPMAL